MASSESFAKTQLTGGGGTELTNLIDSRECQVEPPQLDSIIGQPGDTHDGHLWNDTKGAMACVSGCRYHQVGQEPGMQFSGRLALPKLWTMVFAQLLSQPFSSGLATALDSRERECLLCLQYL